MKIISTKLYTVEVSYFDNDTIRVKRTNDGFNTLELLGVLNHAQLEIQKQMAGEIKPTITERNVVKTDDGKDLMLTIHPEELQIALDRAKHARERNKGAL